MVAIYTTRKSSQVAAESSLERSLRERIILRDEQIAELEKEVSSLSRDKLNLEKEKMRLLSKINERQEEIRVLKKMLEQVRKEKGNESQEHHRK